MFQRSQPTDESLDQQSLADAERELLRAIAEELRDKKPLPPELRALLEAQE